MTLDQAFTLIGWIIVGFPFLVGFAIYTLAHGRV